MRKWKQEDLEQVPCDFCGSNAFSCVLTRQDEMLVVECGTCGLAYLNPRPKKLFIPKFYEEDYFNGARSNRGEGGLTLTFQNGEAGCFRRDKLPRTLEIINNQTGNIVGKTILEIGCATGDLLLLIRAMGAKAKGLEISEFAAAIARKRFLDVTTGTIEEYAALNTNKSSFDLILSLELIEHVLSPRQFFHDVASLIRDGGFLVMSTPNYACANRYGKDWVGFKTSYEHLYFFTLDVLKRMAFKSGFILKYWETSMASGGPQQKQKSEYIELQKNRLIKLSYFISEYELPLAVSKFIKKEEGYSPYGSGHNLVVVFEKNGPR